MTTRLTSSIKKRGVEMIELEQIRQQLKGYESKLEELRASL